MLVGGRQRGLCAAPAIARWLARAPLVLVVAATLLPAWHVVAAHGCDADVRPCLPGGTGGCPLCLHLAHTAACLVPEPTASPPGSSRAADVSDRVEEPGGPPAITPPARAPPFRS
jgi:hypothetical protein